MRHARRRATFALALATASVVLAGAVGAGAQLPPVNPLATTTTTRPPGNAPPTTSANAVGGLLRAVATTTTTPSGRPVAPGVAPAPGLPGNGEGDGVPPLGAGPFPAELRALMNSVHRTRARNTAALVDAARTLQNLGAPHDEAVRLAMGRFPVGGYATYSHDWWFPRFGPGWRLHQGTDIFAAMGTPVRAPAAGTVRFANGGLGGLSTYVVQGDGTYYYLAHLQGRPTGLRDGQAVAVGDVVGFVGNSGNARGGAPHLHFEFHPAIRMVTTGKGRNRTTKAVARPVRPGTVLPAVDPKAYLDQFLDEAIANIPAVVAAYQARVVSAQAAAAAGQAAVPAPPAGPLGFAGPELAAGELAVVGPGRPVAASEPVARLPLAALAFVLMVIAASLMGAFRPRPAPVLVTSSRPLRPFPPLRRKKARRSGRRGVSPAALPSATPPSPAPAPRRRRWSRGGR